MCSLVMLSVMVSNPGELAENILRACMVRALIVLYRLLSLSFVLWGHPGNLKIASIFALAKLSVFTRVRGYLNAAYL